MPRKRLDLTGKVFGELTVIGFAKMDKNRRSHWDVVCSHGNIIIVEGRNLVRGNTKSCRCHWSGWYSKLKIYIPRDEMNTRIANSYCGMLARCYSERHKSYINYGGRGITVCERWLGPEGYKNFKSDMGERPYGKTLDRIDPNGNYCPENTRWATDKQQNNNKRKRYCKESQASAA